MRLVIHQISALQGAAILASIARRRRLAYLVEEDALGAVNEDRSSWIYERAAALILPALETGRPEPQLEDYEPSPVIEPSPVYILQRPVTFGAAENLLPKVMVRRPTLQLVLGGGREDKTLSA